MAEEPFSTLTLKDGRKLAYLEVGAKSGPVVFHFHGHGSSRLEALVMAEAATQLGLRIVALDRPGIGRSDPKPGDRLLDWPDDVAEAADLLGIDTFSVQGMSAGGPFALACAYTYRDRVAQCSLISSVPPPDIGVRAGPGSRRFAWWLAYHFPNYLREHVLHFGADGTLNVELESRLMRVGEQFGGEDFRLMHVASLRTMLTRTMLETTRQNGDGNRAEIERLMCPWGFNVREIAGPRFFVWHGEDDRIMPVAPAREMARALRDCTQTFYTGQGHFSVLVNRHHQALAALRP